MVLKKNHMNNKIKKPVFLTGEIYFVDEFDLNEIVNFKKEFDIVEYDYKWSLSRGMIIQNGENEKLKFDIIPTNDYYDCFFTGFLYSDNTVLGKIKYIQDANESDAIIKGQYNKINKNRLLIRGIWDDTKGLKEFFWLELISGSNLVKK